MKRRVPLSPNQSASFAMGRTLIVFDAWSRTSEEPTPLELDRALLIDFAAQHPRSVQTVVPDLQRVIRAYALQKHDLSDAFARGHLGIARERFSAIVTALVARSLLDIASHGGDRIAMEITALGRHAATQFTCSLSMGLRAVCETLSTSWRRRNVGDLAKEIRRALPDESAFAAGLREPFAEWMVEVG